MSGRRRSSRNRLPSSEDSFVPPETSSRPADLDQQQSSGSQSSIEQQDGKVSNTFDKANSNPQSMVLRSRRRITPNNPFDPEHEESLSSDAESFRQGLRYRKTTRGSPSTCNATGVEYRGNAISYSPLRPGTIPQQDEVAAIVQRWGPRRYQEDVEVDIVDQERQRATTARAGGSHEALQSGHTTHQEATGQDMTFESRPDHTSPSPSPPESTPAAGSRETEEAPVEQPVQDTPRPWNPHMKRVVAFCLASFRGNLKLQGFCCVAFILLDMIIALFFNVSLAIHGPISLRPEPLLNIEEQVNIIRFHSSEQPDRGELGYFGPNLLHHVERNRVAVEFCEVVRHEWHNPWVEKLLDEQSVCYQPDLPHEISGKAQESKFYEPDDDEERGWEDEWDAFADRKKASDIPPPSPECERELLPYALPGLNVSQMIQLDDVCLWYTPKFQRITTQFIHLVQGFQKSGYGALIRTRRELDARESERGFGKYPEKARRMLELRDGYNLLTAYNFMEEYPVEDGDLEESAQLRDFDDEFYAKKQRAKERGSGWFTKAKKKQPSKRYVRKNHKAGSRKIRIWYRHRLGRLLQMQKEVENLTKDGSWLWKAFMMLDLYRDILSHAMEATTTFCRHHYDPESPRWPSACDDDPESGMIDVTMFLDKEYDSENSDTASRMLEKVYNATRRIKAPFESIDSQRCALSSLYALLEGISDHPPHALEVAMSPSGRINFGYATASAAEPLGGMLLRLTPEPGTFQPRRGSTGFPFPECGALSPWQNANKALHNDDNVRDGQLDAPVESRYNPKRTSWAWISLRTYGKLRALVFSFIPVPQWWSEMWRAYSIFGWPDIDQVVQRMPDRRSWDEFGWALGKAKRWDMDDTAL